jgi:hypothetical protein
MLKLDMHIWFFGPSETFRSPKVASKALSHIAHLASALESWVRTLITRAILKLSTISLACTSEKEQKKALSFDQRGEQFPEAKLAA